MQAGRCKRLLFFTALETVREERRLWGTQEPDKLLEKKSLISVIFSDHLNALSLNLLHAWNNSDAWRRIDSGGMPTSGMNLSVLGCYSFRKHAGNGSSREVVYFQ